MESFGTCYSAINNSANFIPFDMIKPMIKILICLLFMVSLGQSKTIKSEEVLKAGKKLLFHSAIFNLETRHPDELFALKSDSIFPINDNTNGRTIAHVLQLEPTGFVVLSNDDRINPVLAYSKESQFWTEDVPQNTMLQMIRADLTIRFKALEENRTSPATILNNQQKWYTLLSDAISESQPQAPTDIFGPFITSMWGQGKVNGANVFNIFTPNNWSTGCVATAMSQILHYYRWPERGIGNHLYNEDDAGVISVNFDSTYYDWENMLDIYRNVPSSRTQKEAVALLGFHCGVSVEMDYEYSGSTASTRDVPAAVSNHFAYFAEYRDDQSTDFFLHLKNEMLRQHPVQIALSTTTGLGHSVVVDGYADHNNYYHLNMGWLGTNNGWYDLAGSFKAGGYSIIDGAVLNFTPVPVFEDSFQLSPNSLFLAWHTSYRINPEKYELQFSENKNGPWITLESTIADSFYTANMTDLLDSESKAGTVYFRVRACADSAWSGWSPLKAIKVRPDRKIRFRVDMTYQSLNKGDIIVVRGNIPPLSGYQNSEAFCESDSSGVYETTISFDYSNIDQLLKYRYAIVSGNSVIMEAKNREYQITSDEFQFLPKMYFDDYTTDIEIFDKGISNANFSLLKNYPNPFNAATWVQYSLQQASLVNLDLYDIRGRFVTHLIQNEYHSAGSYQIHLDFNQPFLRNHLYKLASGAYFVVLKAKQQKSLLKIMYLK